MTFYKLPKNQFGFHVYQYKGTHANELNRAFGLTNDAHVDDPTCEIPDYCFPRVFDKIRQMGFAPQVDENKIQTFRATC